MSDPDYLWEGDANETVIEEWTAETTPFERVRHVLYRRPSPSMRSASRIALV
jgi:hypothetical protein